MLRCGGTRCIRTFASDARLKQHRAKCDGWLNAQNLQKERSVALSRGKVQSTGKTIVLPSQHVMVSMDVRSHEQQAEATNKNISVS